MPSKHPPKSLTQFLKELEEQNKTLAAWAREKKLPIPDVYAVARGITVGRRGSARAVVIAMGMQPPPMHGTGRKARAENAGA